MHARATVIKSDPDERYVFAPMYPAYQYDAHNEWSDSDELRKSLHSYMRGSREIRLQHSPHVIGEAVEGFSSPWELPVTLSMPNGESNTVTLPAGTTYLGAIIKPQFWPLYKRGLLRGWSVGGLAHRIEIDIEGQEEFAKSITIAPDIQIVADVLEKSFTVYSPSTARTYGRYDDFDTANTHLSTLQKHLIDVENPPIKTNPNPDNLVRSIASNRGMGVAKTNEGFTLVSPTTRYSADVSATAAEMQASGYAPIRTANNWTNGGYGITTHYQDAKGTGILVTHHTPESHHYSEGKKTIVVPNNARKLRIGSATSESLSAGAGMTPIMSIGSSSNIPSGGEGIYSGQNSLLAGAPPIF